MAYSEQLATRIREALAELPDVEEKKMFGGVAFMVNGKMCINVSGNDLMCRIHPSLHEAATAKDGCTTVQMKGRDYKGYVYVSEEVIKAKNDLDYWITLSLDFNKEAKASVKRNKK